MRRPVSLAAGMVAFLATALYALEQAPGQNVTWLAGQPIAVTPEFEPENLLSAVGAENVAGMVTTGGENRVLCVAYSPDGKTLAVGDGPNRPLCSFPGPAPINENGGLIRLVDTATNRVRMTLKPNKQVGHEYEVQRLVFLRDGQRLVAAGREDYREGDKPIRVSTLAVWDTITGQTRKVITGSKTDYWFTNAIAADGRRIALALEDGTVRVWETSTGAVCSTFRVLRHPADADDHVSALEFSPDGRFLASGGNRGDVMLWDVATGHQLAHFPGRERDGKHFEVRHLAFSPDGTVVAEEGSLLRNKGDEWMTISELALFDVPKRSEIARVPLRDGEMVFCMRFAADGKTLVTGGPEGVVRLWDSASGRERPSYKRHDSWLMSLAFSPGGALLAAGDRFSITLWDTATCEARASLLRHPDDVTDLAFSPDGATLASAGGNLKLWNLRAVLQAQPDSGHFYEVTAVAYSPDGQTLASGSVDQTIKLWDWKKRRPRSTLRGHTDEVLCIAFAPNGKALASGSSDRTIRVWDPTAGKVRRILKGHTGPVGCLAFAPDGRTLASGSGAEAEDSGEVRLWDSEAGRLITTLPGHLSTVNALAFSPDGTTLAVGKNDDTVALWDLPNVRERATLSARLHGFHSEGILCMAFSPRGKLLATGSRNNTVRIWDLTAGEERGLGVLEHNEFVLALAFSPNGQALATADRDGTLNLWSVPTRKRTQVFQSGKGWFTSVAFAPDGKTLAAGHLKSSIMLWHLK